MAIYDEVLAFIQAPEPTHFESLALKVFRHQFDTIAPYRQYCLSRGVRPGEVHSLDQIPALSTAAFKYVELGDMVTPSEPASARVFMTSGTTAGHDERGRHRVPRLEIYRASALGHLRKMLFPDKARMRMLSLHPTADRIPESSLGQMISWMIEEFGAGEALCVADRKAANPAPATRRTELQMPPSCQQGRPPRRRARLSAKTPALVRFPPLCGQPRRVPRPRRTPRSSSLSSAPTTTRGSDRPSDEG